MPFQWDLFNIYKDQLVFHFLYSSKTAQVDFRVFFLGLVLTVGFKFLHLLLICNQGVSVELFTNYKLLLLKINRVCVKCFCSCFKQLLLSL